jgi:DNA-binding CsgD family transcriptional regulator
MAQNADQLSEDRLAALERLTDREKDCLRRLLRHQTAKEMAIDMGVSPHAIEKRLKMARTKLGVSSSLQASRLLAISEGYQTTVPQPSDLGGTLTPRKALSRRSMAVGAFLMSITVVAIVSAVLNAVAPAAETIVIPKPGEIVISGPSTFDELDKDNSGYLEGKEAPSLLQFGGNPTYERLSDGKIEVAGDYVTMSDGKALQDRFYLEADINRDGKVSSAEFKGWTVSEVLSFAVRPLR